MGGQVQAGADQPDRQHRARRPQRAGLGQDSCQGSQRFYWTHVNDQLCNRPQLINGQTKKPALRNIVIYPIFYLSVSTNLLLSNGIVTKFVLQGGFFDCSALKMTKYKEK